MNGCVSWGLWSLCRWKVSSLQVQVLKTRDKFMNAIRGTEDFTDNYAECGEPVEVWLPFSFYQDPLWHQLLCSVRYKARIRKVAQDGSYDPPQLIWKSYDFKLQIYWRLLWFEFGKDHGKSNIKVRPPLVRHLSDSHLLEAANHEQSRLFWWYNFSALENLYWVCILI